MSNPPQRPSFLRFLPLLCLALLPWTAAAQATIIPSQGKEFWLGFMRNWGGWAPPYTLDIIISSDHATSGTISMPRLGHSWPFTTVPGVTTSITIPVEIGIHNGSEFVDDRAVHIQANDSIAVFAVNYESFSTDGTVVFPVEALGTDYRIVAYNGMAPGPGVASEFLIVATKDGTEVEINTTAITAAGHMPGQPWTVQLDSGQTYQVQAFNPLHDFTGSTVRSTEASGSCRPFAVFSGSACAEVPTDCWACDHLYEQALPVNTWGRSYHVVPFVPSSSYLYRVLAHQDGTSVSVDGAAPYLLNAGQYVDQVNSTAALYVLADKPVAVTQYMKGFLCSGAGDPSMLFLNADHQRTDRITFSTVISTVVDHHYLTVVVASDDVGQVLLDGASVPASEFTPFPADPFMLYARLSIAEGSHTLSCPGGVIGYVYGTGPEESYAYSVGANTVVPAPAPDEVICGTGPDGTVTLTAPGGITGPSWTAFHEPNTVLHEGPTYTFTPTTTQTYVVSGTQDVSACPVRYLYSVELDVPPTVLVTAGSTQVCAFQPVPLSAIAGPMGNYTYSWTPSATLDDATIADPIARPVTDTWYQVTVSTPSGCATATGSILVEASTGSISAYSITPENTTICHGDPLPLQATAWRPAYQDDFDNGIGDLWLNAQGWALSDACGSVAGDALYFNGAPDRYVETVDLDLQAGALLRFVLTIGAGMAPCDDAEPGDDVVLEYSTDAGTDWSAIATFVEWAYPSPTPVELWVPSSAWSSTTRLRWRQLGTWTTGQDNWALDQVSISVPDVGGTPFVWSPSSGLSDHLVPSPVATPAQTTLYHVSGDDPTATCSHGDSVLITVVRPEVEIFSGTVDLCEGGSAVLDAGIHPSYLWSTGASTSSITVTGPGSYWVRVQMGDCPASDTAYVVFAPAPGDLDLVMPLCGGPTWTLTIPVEEGHYHWSTGDTTRSIVVDAAGSYTFDVVDGHGCAYAGAVALVPGGDTEEARMPNVITPNGDGDNEHFGPFQSDVIARYELKVFNRWGQLLFEGRDVPWKGRTDGGPVPDGTYFYVLDYRTTCDDRPLSLKGTVTVIR